METRSETILDQRWLLILICLAMAIPLLIPAIPPLGDLPSHMGRYRVMTAIDTVPSLSRAFTFYWTLVGNLGVDLLIIPMSEVFGIELGTKLIVLTIPPITAIGMLWLAREVHGHIPPTAMFALPFAYAYPFQFGFLNFSLAVALVFNLLALWLWLRRTNRLRLRTALFLVLACVLWVVHLYGWGLLGLTIFGIELARRHQNGEAWHKAFAGAVVACLPLTLPLILMFATRTDSADSATERWFEFREKAYAVAWVLRDRWEWFDKASLAIVGGVLLAALVHPRLALSRLLLWPAILGAGLFVVMPARVMGSFYADMRLVPFIIVLGLLAIRLKPDGNDRLAKGVAVAGALFLVIRLATHTGSYLIYDASYRSELAALDALPRGAPTLALVSTDCARWSKNQIEHLPSMTIVRRDAFSNAQWTYDSAHLLNVVQPNVGEYDDDPSQLFYPEGCRGWKAPTIEQTMIDFPRAGFDYVWTIGFPPGRARANDLQFVWGNERSALYRVMKGEPVG